MPDLFDNPEINTFQPLAARMRPRNLDEYIGQAHLLSEGKPLRVAIEQGKLHSMILWGPPGTGKTTLANLLADRAKARVLKLSAVLSGVKDIRAMVEQAEMNLQQGIPTLVFVDEVHRFNKSQQDAFLPHVEAGTFTFIGATTENPSFELNNALLSRARVYVLKSLQPEDIKAIIDQALNDEERGLGAIRLNFPMDLRQQLAEFADGDARTALNVLDILAEYADGGNIDETIFKEVLGTGTRRFDNGGEEFYNQISALHKSIRGSSPDAALYWFARMLDGGCDALYIARRVVRMASEDIGNADPRALEIALNAWEVQERLGSPEGNLAIAQAIVYLACAAKSNAVYTAFAAAMEDAKTRGSQEVPLHLRNAPTKLMQNLDYGKEYRYAHDMPNAYVPGETYFPDAMGERTYYNPVNRGLESKIAEKLAQLKKWDKAS
tara:strand:+ start:4116 stop:5426 length:1311 start_codon:yes stop_codon:yes gene_type:complete